MWLIFTMIKIIVMKIFFLLVCIWCYSTKAQLNSISIQTEKGLMKVYKTTGMKDMIKMSISCWDEFVAGTKYSSCYLSSAEMIFCIEIADKTNGHCKTGIGFGCTVYDCPDVPDHLPNRVDDENRMCAVAVNKINDVIEIVFIDHVNWESLQHSIVIDQDY